MLAKIPPINVIIKTMQPMFLERSKLQFVATMPEL